MDPDNVDEFVSLLNQKDGILLGKTPDVKDDSEDDTDTDSNSEEDSDDKASHTRSLILKAEINFSDGSLEPN